MRIIERIYFYISILMLLASLSMVFYEQIGVFIWREGHDTIFGFLYTAFLSFSLGIWGIFLIKSAKKENTRKMVISTLFAASYFFLMLLNFILIKYFKIFWIA